MEAEEYYIEAVQKLVDTVTEKDEGLAKLYVDLNERTHGASDELAILGQIVTRKAYLINQYYEGLTNVKRQQ